MKKPKRQQTHLLKSKSYEATKKDNLIQITALIERTPNMVKVCSSKSITERAA